MMKIKKWLSIVLALIAGALSFGMVSQVKAADTGADFTIIPQFGAGQVADQVSYYSLKTKPGQQYPLTVTVKNLSSTKKLALTVSLIAATTTDQGVVNYTPTTAVPDKSAPYLLPDLAQDQATVKTITLAPASSQQVTYQLTMPAQPFAGTILGSIYVQRKTGAPATKNQLGIHNQFAMALPVMLVEAGQAGLTPKLSLTGVKPKTSGGVADLVASIHNSMPVLFGQINIKARLYHAGSTNVLFQQDNQNYEMAPNSTLNYQFATGGKSLAPGDYRLKIKLVSGASTFDLQRDFTIARTTAKTTNQQLIQKRLPWWIWVMLALALVAVGALIFIGIRLREIKSHFKH